MKVLYIIFIIIILLFCFFMAFQNWKKDREIKKANKEYYKREAENARAQESAAKIKQQAHSGSGRDNSDYMAQQLHELAHKHDKA